MLLSDLIAYLQKQEEELGDVNICVYSECHELPCESFLLREVDDEIYVNFCENNTKRGKIFLLS